MVRGALYRAAVKAVTDGEEGLFYDDIPAEVTRALGLAPDDYATHPGEDPALRRRTGSRAARRGEPAGVPRPGARLAGHHAQPGAGRTDPGRLPGPGRRRGQRRAVAGLLPRAARRRTGSPRAGLPGAARRDAQVPGDRRRVLRPRRVRPHEAAQPGGAAPGVGRRRRRPARRGDRLPGTGRPGTARDLVFMSGRGKFGRYLKRAGRFPGYLRAISSDDAQQIIGDLLQGAVRRRRQPAHRGPAPPAARCPRLPGPRGRARMAARRRRARRR